MNSEVRSATHVKSPPLTKKRLRAIVGAVNALLAGEHGEGDWPAGVSSSDMQGAADWARAQLARREARRS